MIIIIIFGSCITLILSVLNSLSGLVTPAVKTLHEIVWKHALLLVKMLKMVLAIFLHNYTGLEVIL